MKIQILLPGLLVVPFFAGAQSPVEPPAPFSDSLKLSYIRSWEASAPETDPSALVGRPLQDVMQTTAYFDGLGRPLQTVVKNGSLVTGGDNADLVTAMLYDDAGRETYKYLPFAANGAGGNAFIHDGAFKQNPFQQQVVFYNGLLAGQPGETNIGPDRLNWAYEQLIFEAAPLNRLQESFSPGAAWVGTAGLSAAGDRHSIKMRYWLNTTTDSVRLWVVDENVQGLTGYYTDSCYAAGRLYKNVTADEAGRQVIEFRDKAGKVVLKKMQLLSTPDDGSGSGHAGWLCTYYIYDDLGNLRCVIQPKGVEQLMQLDWNMNAGDCTVQQELCFQYEYDRRSRMTRKKLPGIGSVYMVYDARDRLVLSQDSNMRKMHQWLYTQYDDQNRPWATGLLTDPGHYNNPDWHRHLADTSIHYPDLRDYTTEVLTLTFYDDYDWLVSYPEMPAEGFRHNYDTCLLTDSDLQPPYAQRPVQSTLTKGLVTGSRVKLLGSAETYLYTVNIYDDKGRVIQTKSGNVTGGIDYTTTQYSWNGQPLVVVEDLQKEGEVNPQNHLMVTSMEYDQLGRLLNTRKSEHAFFKHTGTHIYKAEQTIVQNKYDALGRLHSKTLGSETGPLETLDYDYNVRGWALGVNRDFVKQTEAAGHYFGYDLGYDHKAFVVDGESLSYNNRLFNGNVSGMLWKSAGDNKVRRYDFTYDPVNRLNNAAFTQFTDGSFNRTAGIDFSVYGIQYDANGNILRANRHGWKLGGSEIIDSLVYQYAPGSNRLRSVTDAANNPDTKLGDFSTSAWYMQRLPTGKDSNTIDYGWDGNGNLCYDLNKNLGDKTNPGIHYNYLNLPDRIEVRQAGGSLKGIVSYDYDALGNRVRKVVADYTVNPQRLTTTTYLSGGAVYENDTLQFLGQEQGRLRFSRHYYTNGDSALAFEYDYFLKDHLGNVRMVLTDQKDTAQYVATLEEAYATREEKLFDNLAASRYPTAGITGYPVDTSVTSPNNYVARLNGSGQQVGPSLVLKVMSGDTVIIAVKAFYPDQQADQETVASLDNILNALMEGLVSVAGVSKDSWQQLTSPGNPLYAALAAFTTPANDNPPGKPQAALNWILVDEQFNFVKAGSGSLPVGRYAANTLIPLSPGQLAIPRNGFLYIYVNNATKGRDVYFNDLSVQHQRGPLLEETHYYPFGMKMAGISHQAAKRTPNRWQTFQEQPLDEELGLHWIPFKYRTHDPQLGRFLQVDPLADDYRYQSPYNFSENRVMDGRELEGMEYATIHHYANGTVGIKMHYKSTDKEINRIGGTTSGSYNSASYGPLGRGVVHLYYDQNGEVVANETRSEQKQEGGRSDFAFHGLYSGPGSITMDGGEESTNYDFSFQPIDWADAIAKRHDMDYAAATSNGEEYAGFLEDVRTLKADKDMVRRVQNLLGDVLNPFKKNGVKGVETPFRTSSSGEMVLALQGQLNLISTLAIYKQWKIDHNYTNHDKFDQLRDQFRKYDPVAATIIDAINSKP